MTSSASTRVPRSERAASLQCCPMRLFQAVDTKFSTDSQCTSSLWLVASSVNTSLAAGSADAGRVMTSDCHGPPVCMRACVRPMMRGSTGTSCNMHLHHLKKTHIKAASQSLSQCPLEGLVSLQQLSSSTHSKWLMRIKDPCALTKCLWFCKISFCSSLFIYFLFFNIDKYWGGIMDQL